MSPTRPRRHFAAALVFPMAAAFLLGAGTAGAQVLYGSIVGNAHDATGAVLPGATVTIVHDETKLKRETVSDSAGAYTFTAVPTRKWCAKCGRGTTCGTRIWRRRATWCSASTTADRPGAAKHGRSTC